MQFLKSVQGSKSQVTKCPVSIESTLLLLLLMWNLFALRSYSQLPSNGCQDSLINQCSALYC